MKLIVNPHTISIQKELVNEKEINVTICEFEFNNIPDNYVKEAYFTYDGKTYKEIISNDKCSIPYEVLDKEGQIEIGVVAYEIQDEEFVKRYNPSPAYFNSIKGSLKDNAQNSEPITPSEMEQYEQALNEGLVEVANVDIDASKSSNTATVTITNRDGTSKSVEIYDGEQGIQGPEGPAGKDGKDGIDGQNGITPTIGNNGNWYLGDTDTGKPSRGENGQNGRDGTNGQDGYSPVANVSKSGSTATISITDKNGTTTATVSDGQNGTNGQDGADGYSPSASVSQSGNTTTISITDKNGTTTANIDLSGKLDTSKVTSTYTTTSGDIYDATYINSTIGNINTILATLTTPSNNGGGE